MATKCITCDVEFIGGPADGHVEHLNNSPAPFILATARRPWSFQRWLRGWMPWCKRAVNGVPVYELRQIGGRLRYHYAGSTASLPRDLPQAVVRMD